MLAQPVTVTSLLGGGRGEPATVLEHAVLLDDDPAVVATIRERRAEALHVGVSLAQDAEEAAPPRGKRVRALGLDALEHVEPDVLEVHGADPLAPVGERPGPRRRRRPRWAAVEQQLDVGVLEQTLDLGNALDIGRGVVVEDRVEAALARGLARMLHPFDQRPPARVVEPQ